MTFLPFLTFYSCTYKSYISSNANTFGQSCNYDKSMYTSNVCFCNCALFLSLYSIWNFGWLFDIKLPEYLWWPRISLFFCGNLVITFCDILLSFLPKSQEPFFIFFNKWINISALMFFPGVACRSGCTLYLSSYKKKCLESHVHGKYVCTYLIWNTRAPKRTLSRTCIETRLRGRDHFTVYSSYIYTLIIRNIEWLIENNENFITENIKYHM